MVHANGSIKSIFKKYSHNPILRLLSKFGKSMHRLYENHNHDIHSNGEAWLLKQLSILNPRCIFDVGANSGSYSFLARKICPDAEIYSFEPTFKPHQKFSRKLKSHDNKNIYLIKKGLFKEQTTLRMQLYEMSEHATLYPMDDPDKKLTGYEDVELIRGDDFVASRKIDFIDVLKIDAEGAELDILRGLHESLTDQIIRLIQFEYGYLNIESRNLLKDFYEFLVPKGYVIGKLYPSKVDFRDYKYQHEDFKGPNFVAVRNNDDHLVSLLSH